MKKAFLLGLALLFSLSMSAQHFALKNNLLYDATTTPNLGFEVGLSKKVTLDVSAGYNPFKFNDGKKLKHWLVGSALLDLREIQRYVYWRACVGRTV